MFFFLFLIDREVKPQRRRTEKEEVMDSEKALELVKHGATLLFLDVPQHTLIGIDTQVSNLPLDKPYFTV